MKLWRDKKPKYQIPKDLGKLQFFIRFPPVNQEAIIFNDEKALRTDKSAATSQETCLVILVAAAFSSRTKSSN